MEKTIKEWFNELPDGYRERALCNLKEPECEWIVEYMDDALCAGFDWNETSEGVGFWAGLCTHYALGTTLPPLPNSQNK